MVTKPPIVDLEDSTESINMLIYGDSGVGKTVLAGTAPRALFLATEKGTVSARRAGSKAKLWPCPTWQEFTRAYEWLKNNPSKFDWVIVDSVTEMQQLALIWILEEANKDNPKRDIDIPQLQDHLKWQNMYKRYVRAFNDLPQNVVYTATAIRKYDENGDDIVLPDLQGKDYGISAWTCASMHMYGYLSVQNSKKTGKSMRMLLTETNNPYQAKDRYNVLGSHMVQPTVPKIIAKINGGEAK